MKDYEPQLAELSYTAWSMLENKLYRGWAGVIRTIFMLGYEAGQEAERERPDPKIWKL